MNLTAGLKSKTHWWIFLLAAFIAFFHCLVLGRAYFADDLLYGYGPFRTFLKMQWAEGHFPLWNPYLLGGQPFFADPNNMLGYPLNYLSLIFSVPYGYSVFYFLHLFLAALGMRFWLKSLRISENASRVWALAYALSGFFWWELIHPPILAAFALFPLLLGTLERLSQELTAPRAFAAGSAAALIFLCGNFQMTSCFYYTGFFYLLGRLFLSPETSALAGKPFPWKKVGLVALFGLWGSLPMLTQLLPAYEFSRYSDRTEGSLGYDNFNSQFSMSPKSLYQFFFPTLGVPPGDTIEKCLRPTSVDNAFVGVFAYLGIWAPFLAFLAFRRRERRVLYFFLGLAVLSLLTAWGKYFPLHRLLCDFLPGIKLSRAPFRFIGVYVAFACALAAFGFQSLEKTLEEKVKSPGLVLPALLYGAVLFLVAFINPGESWREMLALLLGASGLCLWGLTETWKKLGKGFFLAALLLPLFFSGWAGYGQGDPSNFNYLEKFPVTSKLGQTYKAARFVLDANTIPYPVQAGNQTFAQPVPQNIAELFGLRTNSGYNPIFLKKMNDLHQVPQKTYVQLMGIRGFLVGRDSGDQPDLIHKPLDSVHLYELKDPPDFVTAPLKTRVIPNEEDLLAAMKAPGFNPAEEALLGAPLPPDIQGQLSTQKAQLKYDLNLDDPDHQVFQVRSDKNSLVVFSEVMFPGWKALVDGSPADLLTANYGFRSVYLPAGDHKVEFLFQPAWLRPILYGTMAWLLSALLYGTFLLKGRKTAPAAPIKA